VPPRSPKAGLAITVFDINGNDVTARALVRTSPVLPVQPELDETPYGSKLASRRQALLQTLDVQVWWQHMDMEPKRHP